ncbi:MAG TPA: ABC transporter permease [Sedimentisphaerales bacterium]|nr:ABC transporter permease [Sedimentisphaerales bacterium]HNU31664.1 ABC transporter permease [Sedimentisphaerales bacterium]
MKTIWTLVKKDLLRDARHPWGLIVFMMIPVLTAVVMSLVFSPRSDLQKNIQIDLAVLDRDDDFLSRVLRSVAGQGQAAENLRLHLVKTEAEGIRLVEKRKVSAFVVLPENLTVDLLDGAPTKLTLYKNPAQAILPRVVEEGLLIVCIGVSEALDLLQPQIKGIRDMIERDEMPRSLEVAQIGSSSIERMRTVEPYLFPPLVQFKTVNASDYVPTASANATAMEDPNS